MKDGYILGLDVGGTHIRMGMVDRALRAHGVEVTSSRSLFHEPDPLAALAQVIRGYLEAAPCRPALVCAGLPAVLDAERRRVQSATNFPGLAGRDVVETLERLLDMPVRIEHDAYYLLSYDIMASGLANEGVMLGFYFGTGMGNAMYIDGKPYTGRNGAACEIGHMPVPLGRRPCSCGNVGCIEMYCCGKAFEELARTSFPGEPLSGFFARHAGHPKLVEFVRMMAAVIAAEVNIMDPRAVFIGGGLVHMEGFPRQTLVQYVLDNTRKPYPAANLDCRFSSSDPQSGIIGAAIEGWRLL